LNIGSGGKADASSAAVNVAAKWTFGNTGVMFILPKPSKILWESIRLTQGKLGAHPVRRNPESLFSAQRALMSHRSNYIAMRYPGLEC
jgi:hypothetical protein